MEHTVLEVEAGDIPLDHKPDISHNTDMEPGAGVADIKLV